MKRVLLATSMIAALCGCALSQQWHARVSGYPCITRPSTSSIAYDRQRNVLVAFGGRVVNGDVRYSSETFEFDGTTWRHCPTAVKPPGREECAMGYDPISQRVILFGGNRNEGQQLRNDTWAWDGQQWTELYPTTSPSPRLSMAMASSRFRDADPLATDHLYLHGGRAGLTLLREFWRWTGSDWQLIASGANLPLDGLLNESMAWSPVDNALTAFTTQTNVDGELWAFDGNQWSLRTVFPHRAPGGNVGRAATAFDPATGHLLIHGVDADDDNDYRETWSWDGAQWTRLPTSPSHPERGLVATHHATATPVVYDSFRVTHGLRNGQWTILETLHAPSGAGFFSAGYNPSTDQGFANGMDLATATIARRFIWEDLGSRFSRIPQTVAQLNSAGGWVGKYVYHPVDDELIYSQFDWTTLTMKVSSFDGSIMTGKPIPPPLQGVRLDASQWNPDSRRIGYLDRSSWEPIEYGSGSFHRLPSAAPPPFVDSDLFVYDPRSKRYLTFYTSVIPQASSQQTRDDVWAFENGTWRDITPSSPTEAMSLFPRFKGLYHIPELGGLIGFSSRRWPLPQPSNPDATFSVFRWTGTAFEPLSNASIQDIFDQEDEGFFFGRNAAYDRTRRRLRVYLTTEISAHTTAAWDFSLDALQPSQNRPRLGESVTLDVHLPKAAGELALLGLAFDDHLGPIVRDGPRTGPIRLPLSQDALLLQSIANPVFTFLDVDGKGTLGPITVPNSPHLFHLDLVACAVALDWPTFQYIDHTEPERITIIR